MTQGAEANDVVQGQIGDCWFVSALSTLATDDYWLVGNAEEQASGIEDPSTNRQRALSQQNVKGMISGVYPPIFHF